MANWNGNAQALPGTTQKPFATIRQWQVGIGPALASGLNTPFPVTEWKFGYSVGMKAAYDLQLQADWANSKTNTDMKFFTLSLGSNYYFYEGDTPFLTADLGLGWAHAHFNCVNPKCQAASDDANGIAVGVGGGYKFRDLSFINLGILARYDQLIASTRHGSPGKYSLQTIVYW
jgi:hypothetical protein